MMNIPTANSESHSTPAPAKNKVLIYLADLTHTGQVVASNFFPLASGLLGVHLLQNFPEEIEVELFKYPNDLADALKRRTPRILGFSNYSWNCDLSYQFASKVKNRHPETVILFGGPNYDLSDEEIQAFWRRYSQIDFYVVKEGERALVELFRTLKSFDFDVAKVKAAKITLPNCHFLRDGEVVQCDLLPRIKDLGELASPYLTGLMDKFFDNVLTPLIHTTRGCPFACKFCTEGASYYNKVANRANRDELTIELEYIAERIGTVQDLSLSDANFGMYGQDKSKALTIAAIKEKYGWPRNIVVNTGKNQKERIIAVADILDGALRIGAALQSTDTSVLQNIARTNISLDALHEIAKKGAVGNTSTFTELILGLPGDTADAHTESLRYTVDAGFGIIRMYQLILLPQTELNAPAFRRQYGMKTMWRIMPRSFGKYELYGETIYSAEGEEICVANNTLSHDDYLNCRELDMTVEILHNGDVFTELYELCKQLGFSWFDFLLRFHSKRREYTPGLRELYDTYRADNQRLWASREDLEREVKLDIDRYLDIKEGTNEMAKAKAVAFFLLQKDIHDALYGEMVALLKEQDRLSPELSLYLQELKIYSLLRKQELVSDSPSAKVQSGDFHFDFAGLKEIRYQAAPQEFYSTVTRRLFFQHNSTQRTMIEGYINQYGLTIDGLGRILMRAPIRLLLRDFSDNPAAISAKSTAMSGVGMNDLQ